MKINPLAGILGGARTAAVRKRWPTSDYPTRASFCSRYSSTAVQNRGTGGGTGVFS